MCSKVLSCVASALWLLAAVPSWAQEHPFLEDYSTIEMPQGVLVSWTIMGGRTCDGQEVQRSLDGSPFEMVHLIEGICGSPESATRYSYLDPSPAEFATVRYRIKLGNDGFSSIRSVQLQRLSESNQRLFPNPVADRAVLMLNVPPATTVELRIWSASGALALQTMKPSGTRLELDLASLAPGLYTYQALAEGRIFSGKLVKE